MHPPVVLARLPFALILLVGLCPRTRSQHATPVARLPEAGDGVGTRGEETPGRFEVTNGAAEDREDARIEAWLSSGSASNATGQVEERRRKKKPPARPEQSVHRGTKPQTSEAKKNDTIAQPREEDFVEAADFGIKAMNDRYLVKEPELYAMGLFLSQDNPARYVAVFNQLTDEAKYLTKYGYAALEATKKFRSKFPDLLRQASSSLGMEKSTLREECPKRGTPQCPPASLRYRTADGSCNNRKHLWWGSAMSTMQRFLPAVYKDGIETIRESVTGAALPSARLISNYIHEERDAPLLSVTHMLMQWGQFIDHDITATGQSRAFMDSVPQCCLQFGAGFQPPEFMHPDCMPIEVHPEDTRLGQFGVRCLEFVRSGPAPREDCSLGAREQLSQVTSFIDASTVYSSNARHCDSLRIFRNGLLQYGKLESRRPVLPRDDSDLCRRGSLSTTCFRAGDNRLSEQPALISLHVIFLRLHNRLATQMAALNQHWSDEKIFQETRRIVGAIVQHITYREFLPIVLGPHTMNTFELELLRKGYYEGYDEEMNPNIANDFSAAAYRFGHSLVQHSFARFDKNHRPLANNVTIHEEFSNPANLETAGSVDRILLGLVNQRAQKRDEFMTGELTNHLFQTPGFPFGMDLASINIQRGRDHGIPPYVDWRVPCSLKPIKKWSDLDHIMSPDTARKFQEIYASVEDIDLFSAGLAEKPVSGGLVGPTFACIIAQQFRAFRKGDRFWYENPFVESAFTLPQLQQIRKVTLAQILCRTLENIEDVQPFVMLMADNLRNQRLTCEDPILEQMDLSYWVEKPLQQRNPSPADEEVTTEESVTVTDEEVDIGEIELETEILDEEDTEARAKKKPGKTQTQTQNKPMRTRINQSNRISVRRPLGPNENLTIVVHNNAVNSPIFVSDSIYGSNVQINKYQDPDTTQRPQNYYQRPSGSHGGTPLYNTKPSPQPNYSSPPTNTYMPHNYGDPDNPNPPSYGYNRPPTNEFFSYNIPSIPGTQPEDGPFGNQQNSYQTTRRPRPTTRPPYVDYEQWTEENSSPNSGGSYNQNSRPQASSYGSQPNIQDSYFDLDPNNSDRDGISPSYQNKPVRRPKPPKQTATNQYQPAKRPQAGGNIGDKIEGLSRPGQQQTYGLNPAQINYQLKLQNPSYVSTSATYLTSRPTQRPNSQLSSYKPQTPPSANYNFDSNQDEDVVRNMPQYIHTHTTISDIQYVQSEKPNGHKETIGEELPRPIINLQIRESNDHIEKQSTKENSPVTVIVLNQNFTEKNNTNSKDSRPAVIIQGLHNLPTEDQVVLESARLPIVDELDTNRKVTSKITATPEKALETVSENDSSNTPPEYEFPKPILLRSGH